MDKQKAPFLESITELVCNTVKAREMKMKHIKDIYMLIHVSRFLFIEAFVRIQHSNVYTAPSLQTNECKFWQIMDDKPIARVLSYHPKMIHFMHYPCSEECKNIPFCHVKAVSQARTVGKKRLHFHEDTERKRSVTVNNTDKKHPATVDYTNNKRYMTVNDKDGKPAYTFLL
jgi:hypothetical protein